MPGPAHYNNTSIFGDSENGSTMKSRSHIKRQYYGPGPAGYLPPRAGKPTLSPTLKSRTNYPGTTEWDIKHKLVV